MRPRMTAMASEVWTAMRVSFYLCAEVLAHDNAGADGHALTETDEQVDG